MDITTSGMALIMSLRNCKTNGNWFCLNRKSRDSRAFKGGGVFNQTSSIICGDTGARSEQSRPSGVPSVNPGKNMTTIRFGTTTGPCKTATAQVAQLAEEMDEKGNCDPDKLLQCPFDKNHQIRACRFPYHLIKCRKNHPKLASELKTCPFNARHLVPKHELTHHTETCVDRISLDADNGVTTNGQYKVPVSTWVNPDMTEDWDKEANENATPFVWGVNPILNQKPEMMPTNNLGPSFRTPNTLPWSGL